MRSQQPGTTLQDVMTRVRSHPITVEAEVALQDFLELEENQRLEFMFRTFIQHAEALEHTKVLCQFLMKLIMEQRGSPREP